MTEKIIRPISGYLALLILLLVIVLGVYLSVTYQNPIAVGITFGISIFIMRGFFFFHPNDSRVLVLFGKYVGTVKENGFHWTNPFYSRDRISLRARNLDSERVKVNDKLGNPILISVIWFGEFKKRLKRHLKSTIMRVL